jgi:deoxyribose-phosphate aldolase
VEDVTLMRAALLPEIQIKAAGGVRSHNDALALLKAGASRIGTSSGVAIVEESRKL